VCVCVCVCVCVYALSAKCIIRAPVQPLPPHTCAACDRNIQYRLLYCIVTASTV